ncbi:MAG: hypothetical protein CVT48_05625 [Thermoplasmata archaeon HGW-Thermoplasmata-1]|nr:MAG: hypothetical protein CVT48_05625 [Thermoplasmata archaeon HGW-Thermoplasmata-1]
MKKDDGAFLKHMRDAILRITEYTANVGHDEFIKQPMMQDAVIRQIEIMGEATKSLSAALKTKYPDVPWKDIAGMRDKLIHGYFGVDIEAVWDTVEQDISELLEKIEKIFENLD